MAAWMATELFSEFGGDVAISLVPSSGGRFEVDLGDVEVFNGLARGIHGIDPTGVSDVKMAVHERVGA